MDVTRRLDNIHHGGRWTPLSQWLVIAAAVLGLATTDGRLASTSFAAMASIVRPDRVSQSVDDAASATTAPVARPDFRTDLVSASTGQTGQPFSYTVQVRNAGVAAGNVRVST